MNITFINRMMGIKFGGGENFDLNMARALVKRGHNIRFVIGIADGYDEPIKLDDEFEVIRVKTKYLRDIHYKVKPTNIINKIISVGALEIDLRIFENKVLKALNNDNWSDIYQICGLPRLGAKLKLNNKIKSVVRWPGPPAKRRLKWMRECDVNFAHGNTMIKLKELSPDAHNIQAGVDLNKFYPLEIDNKVIRFIFVGRLIPIKRLDFLINSFNEAYKINNKIELLIIGNGTEKENLKKLVTSNIKFLGEMYDDLLYDNMRKSDVFCITSEYESFSMVVLEAMSSGLPIIATNVGYLPNLITDNGILVELDNLTQLKESILELANNKEKRLKFGEYARNRIENEFSWDKSALLLEDILRDKHVFE